MARVAAGMIVFNDMPWVPGVLHTMYPYVCAIEIVEGPVEYWQSQGYTHSTDGTIEAILDFPDSERKIHLICGQWPEKEEMANRYMAQVERHQPTHVWHLDADEFYLAAAIERTLAMLDEWDAVGFQQLAFVDFKHCITGFKPTTRINRYYDGAKYHSFRPVQILDPSTRRGWSATGRYLESQENFFHYAYVFKAQRRKKEVYYRSKCLNCILTWEELPAIEFSARHPQWIAENLHKLTQWED